MLFSSVIGISDLLKLESVYHAGVEDGKDPSRIVGDEENKEAKFCTPFGFFAASLQIDDTGVKAVVAIRFPDLTAIVMVIISPLKNSNIITVLVQVYLRTFVREVKGWC